MLQSGMRAKGNARFLGLLLVLLAALVPAFAGDNTLDRGDLRLAPPPARPEPSYKIQAGMDGEIYPVFANYASLQKQNERTFGAVSVTVSNPGDSSLRQRVAVT